MKKIILIIMTLIMLPISLLAVSSDKVNYEISDYIVDSSIDISGNLVIKEIIGVKGTFNGYIRDLVYKNDDLDKFTGEDYDFYGSDIYNGSNIELYKVGKITYDKDLDFDAFKEEVVEFSECSNSVNCYEKTVTDNGLSLKMYNETIDDITYFYIEYLVGNVIVLHNDVAELYYNFVGDNFDDMIDKYQLRVVLPSSTTEQIRVWAHGPLTGEISFIATDEVDVTTYYGGYLHVDNLNSNTAVDMRMVFPKELIMVEHPYQKRSNIDGLDKILKVEQERADDANRQRESARRNLIIGYITSGVFYVGLVALFIFVYLKYDKEYKSDFEGEYYRDFIDDYDVTSVEYLMNKKITDRGFSTSILNMIYKKNIGFEQTGKKDYTFTKLNEDNLNESEKVIMNMLFNKAGKDNKVTLKDIKKYANKISGTNSEFLNEFNKWKRITTTSAENENFYEKKNKVAFIGLMVVLATILIVTMQVRLAINSIFVFISIILSLSFIIYICAFQKRTKKGCNDYSKWKAFRKFLKDFGRFDEKELPEITLWEKYLVYASIFGIADRVGKTMKVKFSEINPNVDSGDFWFDYMLYSNLNHSVNSCIHSSVNNATSKVNEARAAEISSSSNSSGGGFGGGFSSGGGFGGGGGGGRGF